MAMVRPKASLPNRIVEGIVEGVQEASCCMVHHRKYGRYRLFMMMLYNDITFILSLAI